MSEASVGELLKGRICPVCEAWRCSADDAWCGNCGAPAAQLHLLMDPHTMQAGNFAPVRFTLQNRSCADLEVERVTLPPWIRVPATPSRIPAGTAATFTGRADTLRIKEPQTFPMELRTPAGTASAVAVVIEETPVLTTIPAETEVWGAAPQQVALRIAPRAGALRILGVSRGPVGNVDVVTGPEAPVLVSADAGLPVVLQLDPERFRSGGAAALRVEYEGPHGPAQVETPLRLRYRNRPELYWEGEHEAPMERFAMADQPLRFVLSNKGGDGRDGGMQNAQLRIESIELETLPGAGGSVPFQILDPALPHSLRGGESVTIALLADLREVKSAPGAPLYLRLRVRADRAVLDKRVPLFVRPLPDFDGILAIDFGSSNTCAAVVETGGQFAPVPLEPRNEVSPTVLRYLSLAGPTARVEAGSEAKRRAAIDDRIASGTLSELKQRLGTVDEGIPVKPTDGEEWTTRSPRAAVADYLHEVRRAAENSRHCVFQEFILTHPAVCTLRQYRDLYGALMDSFGGSARTVHFLQEPVAALIPYLAERSAEASNSGYTVASFDLGGGTTDIAVIRVEHHRPADGRVEIHPKILFSRGVRFGGENLSDFVQAELERRTDALLMVRRPGAKVVRKGIPGSSTADILRNRFALRENAEAFKASLSEENGGRGTLKPMTLRVSAEGETSDFSVAVEDLSKVSSGDLSSVFREELRRRVRGLAGLLQEAEQKTGHLDAIQLSGKTAYLPEVGQELRRMFPGATVVRAAAPKQCVVTGACLSVAMGRGSARRLVLPDGRQRTTSSVGLWDASTGVFFPLLPVDTPIPEEGLRAEQPNAWFGTEKIALFESLGVGQDGVDTPANAAPAKLGTWTPERSSPAAEAHGWTLQLLLKDFHVSVRALGEGGEVIPFHQDGGQFAGQEAR